MRTIQMILPTDAYGVMVNNYGDRSELMYMVEENSRDETLLTIPLPASATAWKIIETIPGLVTLTNP